MKMARKKTNGEHYFACPPDLWKSAYIAWQHDHTCAAPMPLGHQMFSNPAAYGVDVFSVDDNAVRTAIARLAGEVK